MLVFQGVVRSQFQILRHSVFDGVEIVGRKYYKNLFLSILFKHEWECWEEVLRRAGLKRELMRSIEKRQLQFLGHILRAQGFESDCVLARINGRRARGRQRKKYMDCLTESLGGRYKAAELVQLAKDRLKWRFMIVNVTWQAPRKERKKSLNE